MSRDQVEPSHGAQTALPTGGGALTAFLAGLAVSLILVSLEALYLQVFHPPARPVDALREALLWGFVSGSFLGVVGVALARGRRATDRVRFGLPLCVIVPLVLGVQLHVVLARPGEGLLSPRSLALFGILALVFAAVLFAVLRGGRGPRRSRAPVVFLASLVGVAGAWGLVGGFQSPERVATGPNVVLVVLDTTRVDRLSAFGYGRETTPHLARLADEGLRFLRCYAAAPWTVPSHAAMFTGEHTSTHRANRQRPILDGRLPTLAEKMSARGYHTVSFSKKSWLSAETGLLRGFQEIHDLYNPGGVHALPWIGGLLRAEGKVADKGAQEIVRLASEWLGAHGSQQPFFAFFNFNEAHSDLRPPRRYREQFLEEDDHGTDWGRTRFPKNHDFSVGAVNYDDGELALISDLYDAEIAYQDARLGELVEAFRVGGFLDDTLMIVTADHGENLGEHGLLGHEMSLHETLLHVPLVVRWPRGMEEAGGQTAEPVENRLVGRLIETLLDAPQPLGSDQLALALGAQGDKGIVSEEYAPNFQSPKWGFRVDERFDRIRKTLIEGHLKLSFESGAEFAALYDLLRDPGELVDLAEERRQEAQALLDKLLGQAELWQELDASGADFSAEMQELLEQTGYF